MQPSDTKPKAALWLRGFRPFFLGAGLLAVVTMAMWLAVYLRGWPLSLSGISMFQWHAHEMIFGYAMAVIAGFLLTAAWNWTGRETASGAALAGLFAFWALARLLMTQGTEYLTLATAADLAFMLGLGLAIGRPILRVRQKRQIPVLLIVALMIAAKLLFHLGADGRLPRGVTLGVHGGFYGVLGMVLFMGRRVIPFFTQRGVGYEVELRNDRWNDVATFALFPAFLVAEVFFPVHPAGALLAAALFVLNALRLAGWLTPGVRKKPLLWGLFSAWALIVLGFLMRALAPFAEMPGQLPLHAFAVGGVATVTLSMMARVTLGHTGRNVHRAPRVTALLLGGMVLTAAVRVILPLLDSSRYPNWIAVSGVLWIACFALFLIVFAPMLLTQRIDAK